MATLRIHPRRRLIPGLLALLLATAPLVGCGHETARPGSAVSPGDQATSSSRPTATPGVPTPGTTAPSAPERMLPSPYQPLWPFTGLRGVQDWQRAYRS